MRYVANLNVSYNITDTRHLPICHNFGVVQGYNDREEPIRSYTHDIEHACDAG